MYGREAKLRGRWFNLGLLIGVTWSGLLFIAIQTWGNGAGVFALLVGVPVVILQRWLIARGKADPP